VSTDDPAVLGERIGSVCRLTLNRPRQHNPLTPRCIDELLTAVAEGKPIKAIAAARDLRRANPTAMYEIRPVLLYRPGEPFPLTEAGVHVN